MTFERCASLDVVLWVTSTHGCQIHLAQQTLLCCFHLVKILSIVEAFLLNIYLVITPKNSKRTPKNLQMTTTLKENKPELIQLTRIVRRLTSNLLGVKFYFAIWHFIVQMTFLLQNSNTSRNFQCGTHVSVKKAIRVKLDWPCQLNPIPKSVLYC